MEKYVIWYALLSRARMKKLTFWLMLLGMAGVVLLIGKSVLPQNTNTKIGIYCEDDDFLETMLQNLEKNESIFSFEKMESEEELKKVVISGQLECGFLIDDNIERKMERGSLEEAVICYRSSFSNKTEVAKETFFAAFFECYSEILLKNSASELIGEEGQEALETLLTANQEYLDGKDVFYIEKEVVGEAQSVKTDEKEIVFPVRGTIGLFIFMTVLLIYGEGIQTEKNSFRKYLPGSQKVIFSFLDCMAGAMAEIAFGIVLMKVMNVAENIGIEIIMLLFLVTFSFVWSCLLGIFLKKEDTYMGWMFGVLLLNAVVCPVFFDMAEYIPAVKMLRCFLPLGLYLQLF